MNETDDDKLGFKSDPELGKRLEKLATEIRVDWDKLATMHDTGALESLQGKDAEMMPAQKQDANVSDVDVAKWMLQELEAYDRLYQDQAASHIQSYFGERFVYTSENGNLLISKKVLKEFRMLTPHTVVWNRRELFWRHRLPDDPPDSREVYR